MPSRRYSFSRLNRLRGLGLGVAVPFLDITCKAPLRFLSVHVGCRKNFSAKPAPNCLTLALFHKPIFFRF